jgi:hypothetical protein
MSELWPPGGLLLIPQMIHEYRKPRWNDIYRRKRINRRKACPSDTLSITNPTWTNLSANPGLRGERPETNCLSHGTAVYVNIIFNEGSNPENLQVYFLDARCKKQLVNKTVSMLVFLRVTIFGLVCMEEHDVSSFRVECSSEALINAYNFAQCYNPEAQDWHLHHHEILKFHMVNKNHHSFHTFS